MVDYYAQRASVPGSLFFAETTLTTAKAGGYDNISSIGLMRRSRREKGWRLRSMRRARTSSCKLLKSAALPILKSSPVQMHPVIQAVQIPVSSSDVPLPDQKDGTRPRPLTHKEILELFGQAAHNAVHRAGFDGVEIHGAHGYLIDQFTQDTCNKRTDQWGGSIENRTRFALEVTKKVVSVVGEERTALRLSLFDALQCVLMEQPAAYLRLPRQPYPLGLPAFRVLARCRAEYFGYLGM